MKSVFRKSITVNTVKIGTNDGDKEFHIFGKIKASNMRSTVMKFIAETTSGNDSIGKIESNIINGNFLIKSHTQETKTYECDYREFLKISTPAV